MLKTIANYAKIYTYYSEESANYKERIVCKLCRNLNNTIKLFLKEFYLTVILLINRPFVHEAACFMTK